MMYGKSPGPGCPSGKSGKELLIKSVIIPRMSSTAPYENDRFGRQVSFVMTIASDQRGSLIPHFLYVPPPGNSSAHRPEFPECWSQL